MDRFIDIVRPNSYKLDDRFVIRDGKEHKCAIICPGGGYNVVAISVEGIPIAKELNKHGISAFIVRYRVKGKATYPNPQDDLARAVRYIHEKSDYYNLDMADYSVWGFSAGGHLAGTFGTDTMGYKHYGLPKPGAMILAYPVITLEQEITHAGTRKNLIGQNPGPETERNCSIYTNVTEDYPDTYIWCGTADSTVPVVNTELMKNALAEHGVRNECRMFDGVEHGVGTGENTAAQGWIAQAVGFWIQK